MRKFCVSRTSDWRGEIAPCEGAYREGNEWFLDVKDLDHLVNISARYGNLVLNACGWRTDDTDCPDLEIYDDYRE